MKKPIWVHGGLKGEGSTLPRVYVKKVTLRVAFATWEMLLRDKGVVYRVGKETRAISGCGNNKSKGNKSRENHALGGCGKSGNALPESKSQTRKDEKIIIRQ